MATREEIEALFPDRPRAEMRQEQQEENNNRTAMLMNAAAAVGIGYVAYKNLPQLRQAASNLKMAGQVSLARNTNHSKFTGMIGEALNLNTALDEVIDYSPRGLLKTFRKEGVTEDIARRTASLNKQRQQYMDPSFLEDVLTDNKVIRQNFNFQANVDTALEAVESLYDSKKFTETFQDNGDKAYHILKNNAPELFGRTDTINRDTLDTGIYRLIQDYSDDVTRTVQLDFKTPEEQRSFISKVVDTVNDINSTTERQRLQYQKGNGALTSLEGNKFAQHYESLQMTAFNSIMERHTKQDSTFIESMLENGVRQVTMQDAKNMYVKTNDKGQAFMTDVQEGAQRLQDFYGAKRTKNQFADNYISRGVGYGLDKSKLETHAFSQDLFVDHLTGELLNTGTFNRMTANAMDSFEANFGIPFLNFNPISFLPGRKTKDIQQDMFAVLRGGSDIQPLVKSMQQNALPDELRNINAESTTLARSYLFSNGSIIDSDIANSLTGNTPAARFKQFQDNIDNYKLEGDYSLGNARGGLTSKYAQAVSGRTSRDDLDMRNPLQKLFQLGGQESQSNIENVFSAITKYDNELNTQEAIDLLIRDSQGDGRSYLNNIDDVRNQLMARSRNLSNDAQSALYSSLNEAMEKSSIRMSDGSFLDFTKMYDDDYAFEAFQAIARNKTKIDPLELSPDKVNLQIKNTIEDKARYLTEISYPRDPQGFMTNRRYTADTRLFKPDTYFNQDEALDNTVSMMDDIRMNLEQYAINEARLQDVNLTSKIRTTPNIDAKSVEEQLARLESINEMSLFLNNAKSRTYEVNRHSEELFRNYYVKGSDAYTNLATAVKDVNPLTSTPYKRGQNLLGNTQYVAIRNENNILKEVHQSLVNAANKSPDNTNVIDVARNLAEDIVKPATQTAKNIVGEVTPFSSVGDKSTLTRNLWFFGDRMDTSLQQIGLGLPNASKSTFFNIVKNQSMTRVFGPLMAMQTAMYLDGLTDDKISDTAADTYVNMQLDLSSIKETFGFNDMGRRAGEILPWLEHVSEWAPVRLFNTATLGLFSEFRDREELESYYQSGEDPIRKGRYWGVGSMSPWRGERISYYKPNWYRRMKSDYMFAENVYGSEKEYWQNHWMPTLTKPAAPIRHFITDPYHYEDKHAESRPYVLTGGFNSLQNIPLIGPAVDKAVSSVLKPTRINPRFAQSHEEYVEAQRNTAVSNYLGMNAGGTLTLRSSGSVSLSSDTYDVLSGDESLVDEDGFVDGDKLEQDAENFTLSRDRYITSVYHDVALDDVYMRGGGSYSAMSSAIVSKDPKGQTQSKQDIREINQRLTDMRNRNFNDDPTQAQTLVSPNTIIYQNQVADHTTFFGDEGIFKDIQYRSTEFGGMYGFLSTMAPGVDDGRSLPLLESSSRFNNMADNFWDMNLGGLGGDFSEIFRRYLPRDTNKYYNPIKNDMPDWINYMFSINFFNCWKLLLHMQGQSAA